jgi:TRAP-type mannitol/chloroaromatic compound transport system substrate-binding protein
MERRKFLQQAAAGGLLAGAVASPALAQGELPVRWRLAASWPKSLDTLFGSIEDLCRRVSQLTDKKFEIQPFAAGEIVPPLQVMDAAQNGTVDCGHTLTAFYIGKNPAYAFDSGVAFGLNNRQQNAWMYYGGGLELLRELFKKNGMVQIPCGNVGVQMGGFYRKEINSVDDLKGLKFRIGGLGGTILTKLGVVPQQIPTSDIYPALERGIASSAWSRTSTR